MPRSWSSRILPSVAALVGFSASFASAAVQNRISPSASTTARVTIAGSVRGKARLAVDLGAAPGETRLVGMTLRFSLTSAQQAALDQLSLDQQNPASSRYRQWLTPAQYGAQFGLSSADLGRVTSWLQAQGFHVTEVAASSTFVRFDGTIAQAQAAFATSIHTLSLNGQTYFANVTDAAVPAAFAGVVGGVTGLNNFRLRARVHTGTAHAPVNPQFTSALSGNHFVAPGDFYTIYNEVPQLNNAINGSGVTIAVMGQVDLVPSDIASFRTAAGLAANQPTLKTYVSDPGPASTCQPSSTTSCPSPNQSDLAESSLDVEWSGATAPGASIVFVNSPDVIGDSLTDAIDANLAPIMSLSYGDCEVNWGSSELTVLNQLLQQATVQGITVVGPAGDAGATDCDTGTVATQGIAVDFPASSPFATGAGGTMYNEGTGTYWSTTENSLTAGSAVPAATYSAMGYIPEAVWNEDSINGSANNLSSGGGGSSSFFAKPVWQQGAGVPADQSRDVPDVALAAAASHDSLLYCAAGSCVNGFRDASSNLTVGGGTSFAAPSLAGVFALVEQKIGARIGNANPVLYGLANNPAYNNTASSGVFNDVTVGNNNSPCTAGTPNCPNGGSIGYSATAGYDLASGWGSLNVNNLVNDWSLVVPLGSGNSTVPTFNLTTTNASPTITSGQTPAVTITASSMNGFAGTVTFTAQVQSTTNINPGVTFAPTTVTLTAGGTQTTTVTLTGVTANLHLPAMPGRAVSGTELAQGAPGKAPWYAVGSGATVAGLLLLTLPRRRRLGGLLLAVLAIALVGGVTGCNASNPAINAGSTTTSSSGTYYVTVTGTYSSPTNVVTTRLTTVTFTIQ